MRYIFLLALLSCVMCDDALSFDDKKDKVGGILEGFIYGVLDETIPIKQCV